MNKTYERLWLRFAKGGKMKYIGHLDLMKIFQLAIRRASIPIAYSMGFNPHQRLSFALPLPLGMDSLCEYAELLLDSFMLPDDLLKVLDEQLPDGVRLLSAYCIPEQAPRPAAAVTYADYRLVFPSVKNIGMATEEAIATLQNQPEIIVTKKTKSGEKEADIKVDIQSLVYESAGAVHMRLSAGSNRNLNPQLVAQVIFQQMGISPQSYEAAFTRLELYGQNGKPLHEVAL